MQLANPFAPKTRRAILSIAAAIVAAVTMGAGAPGAEEGSTTLSPQALQEIAQLEAEIDRIEARGAIRSLPQQALNLVTSSVTGGPCHIRKKDAEATKQQYGARR